MQNAQTIYLQTIEGLLEDNEIDKALDALLELDKQSQAGIRSDVVLVAGNYREIARQYRLSVLSFDEYLRQTAKVRMGLLELMKEIPRRVKTDAKAHNINTFQFEVPDEVHLEKVIGQQNNLLKINWLEKALLASKAVCRVVCSDGELGTGFLTKEGYVFTNNHVLPSADIVRDARIEFNYELDANGKIKSRTSYKLDAGTYITSTPDQFDFARVKVIDDPAKPLSQWGYVEFDPSAIPTVGESVTIIQHPKGEDKQIALNANEVLSVWGQYIFYTTDTEPGSSGSPVFNKDWKVVAIHHAGKTDAEGGMQINARGDRKGANRGILFEQIFQVIQGGAKPVATTTPSGAGSRESHRGDPPADNPAPAPTQPAQNDSTTTPRPAPVAAVPKFVILNDLADEAACDRLNKHLFVLKQTRKIIVYNVNKAGAGEDVEARAQAELANADYLLCLITPNLFNENAPWFGIILGALEQGKRVIPIRVEKADVDGTGLEKLRSLPSMNRSVSDFPNQDAAYSDIAEEIKKLVKR